MVQLSKRLQSVVNLVTPGNVVADVGCDHAYISIYLLEQKLASRVIAMDINEGPLKRAKENIEKAGLTDKIETRLSDGIQELKPQEVHTVLLAGMGGILIEKILENRKELVTQLNELILQPQSELKEIRMYLKKIGFLIEKENMVIEDGKYYTMLRAVNGLKQGKEALKFPEEQQEEKEELYNRYGKYLLEHKHKILKQYLEKEKEKLQKILKQLEDSDLEKNRERYQIMLEEYRYCQEGQSYYEM